MIPVCRQVIAERRLLATDALLGLESVRRLPGFDRGYPGLGKLIMEAPIMRLRITVPALVLLMLTGHPAKAIQSQPSGLCGVTL